MLYHCYSLNGVASCFDRFLPQQLHGESGRRKAAVAMLLREHSGQLQMLFIERAADERDPWSGHLAFPGGKIEPGETSQQAAERETTEEIGIMLDPAARIGQLSDIVGTNLPVQVSCHLYIVQEEQRPVLSREVSDLFWVPFPELYDQKRHCTTTVRFADTAFAVPAITLPVAGKPVLWGITYRLVMQLHEILHAGGNEDCISGNSRYTHAIDYL